MGRKKPAPSRLVALCHHRWALPILAELRRASGAKFVTLSRRLGISRDSLRHTLATLIDLGWVARNPGYGHPMRPEYLLTSAGAKVAPWCNRLLRVLRTLKIDRVKLRKWALPVLIGLDGGRERFNDLKVFLPGLTPRALTLTLKDLQAGGLVERHILQDYPPATCYRLTRRARRIIPPLKGLHTVVGPRRTRV